MDRKKLKQIYSDDPEMLRLLESQDQTELLKALAKDKVASDSKTKMVKIEYLKGEPGDKGDPLTWDDLTPEQKDELTGEDGYTPIKGKDYFDGEPGLPGKDADEAKILKVLTSRLPTVDEIAANVHIPKPSEVDVDSIVKRVITELPKQKIPISLEDIVKEIKTKKLLEMRDIRGARLDMSDMRWHGGGLTTIASSGTTVTTNATSLNFTGSGVSSVTDSNGIVTVSISGGGGSVSIGGTVTGGTNGSVLFINPAGVLAQDNTNFYWDNTNKQLQIGASSGFDFNTQIELSLSNNINNYSGTYLQNKSAGNIASTDVIVGADNDGVALTGHFGNFGIASSGNTGGTTFTGILANDIYLYGSGGNLILGTDAGVAGKVIKFFAGGLTVNSQIGQFANTGLTVGKTGTILGKILFAGSTSTQITLQGQAVGSSSVLTLPTGTGTLLLNANNLSDLSNNSTAQFNLFGGVTYVNRVGSLIFVGAYNGSSTSLYGDNSTTLDGSGNLTVNTLTTAASVGTIQIGGIATFNNTITQNSAYAKFGNAAPFLATTTGVDVFGNDNTINGVQLGVGNRNSGSSAYAGLFINNNLAADGLVDHYVFMGLNSSTYTDTTFGTGLATANQFSLQNTDGPVTFIANVNSSSAYFNFLVKGTSTTNEVFRINSSGYSGRKAARTVTVSDSTTIAFNADTTDWVIQTNTQATGTLTISNPTGTPVDKQAIAYEIKVTNTQTLAFGGNFSTVNLPTTIAAGTTSELTFQYSTLLGKYFYTGGVTGLS